jgi:lipopolysaccharide export system permease protein
VVGFLGELRELGGDYQFLQAMLHALLELPYSVNQVFPMLVLLGGVLALGTLVTQQELVVMRASGLSLVGIAISAVLAVIVLAAGWTVIGEGMAPRLHYLADIYRTMDKSSGQAVITADGDEWLHQPQVFIHVRVMPHQHLQDVTRYQFDDQHRLMLAEHTDNMDYQNGHWVAHQVVRTLFNPDNTTRSEQVASAVWDLHINPVFLDAHWIQPEEMSLPYLHNYIQHSERNGMQVADYQFSFWKRVLQPLTMLVMLLLAIPFVLVTPRSVAMGWRLLLAVMIGFSFYIFDAMIGQLAVLFQVSPLLAAIMPIIIFAVIGVVLMRRVQVR